MARWTNDKWKSTPHRVICPEPPAAPTAGAGEGGEGKGNRRQSMAYFCNLPPGVTVACIGTCTGPEDPPRCGVCVNGDVYVYCSYVCSIPVA